MLDISKQAVHKRIESHQMQLEIEAQLIMIIHQIRQDHPTMGVRDLYFKIQPDTMGRDRFEEFCRENELMSIKKVFRPRTTDSQGVIRFENLIIDLTISQIDQVWQSDITYFELNSRFYYLTFIIDAYSRRIVGHSVSDNLTTLCTTLPALQRALKLRGNVKMPNLIFHSDGGGQYYAKVFLELTKKNEIKNSMSEYAWENGKAERINGVIKNNYLIHRNIKSYKQLTKEVDRSVELYNSEKPHKKLQRSTPIEFEKKMLSLTKQNKPKMKESFDAKNGIFGASSPLYSEQNKPQNRDVFSTINLNYELK